MKKSKSKVVFDVFNITLMVILTILTLYPIINQIAVSFSSTTGILSGTVNLIPRDFTLDTYKQIISDGTFWKNYANTIIYTVTGTALGLVMTIMCAYPLSRKDLVGGKTILNLMVFTMFFGGGLVPGVMLIKNLGLNDTIWALIVPGAILPYHVLLVKTFFEGIPSDLEDAAGIDGLTQFGYFMRIVLPLSKPIIATMILFIAVLYWNDWFSALLYLSDNQDYPVTLFLRNIMMGAQTAAQNGEVDGATKSIPASMQAASMLLVITPIMLLYPKIQKYFVKGVMIGAVKG